ncbi:hypothetical protein RIF29_39866 [Crotalaria pallida]|uniref:Uncharacterized protein n=1 Tax=Crotalaria pallida TaxID=3830 RepID=A0AAN9E3N9_CROPI
MSRLHSSFDVFVQTSQFIFHRVLFPIFDHVRYAGKEGFSSTDDDWFRETSIHSLQLLCNLFNTFYKVPSFLLSSSFVFLLDYDCNRNPNIFCLVPT